MSDDPMISATVAAVAENQAEELARLLERCPPSQDELKGLAFLASDSRSLPILQVLLNNGWDINTPETYSEPPYLGRAIRKGASKDVVQWFLNNGADPNAYARQYKITPLSYAAQYAPLEIVQMLLDHGGSAKQGDLLYFTCRRSTEDPDTLPLLRLLHGRGAPVDDLLYERFPELSSVTMFSGTPLWNSCMKGNTAAVQFLLDHGASPLSKPRTLLHSPLDEAVRRGHSEIVKMLLNCFYKTLSSVSRATNVV